MRKAFTVLFLAISFIGVVIMMQNCGTPGQTQHQYPASPFETNKLLLSQQFASLQKLVDPDGDELDENATIPVGTELAVIVRDACMQERLANPPPAPYWIDSYITTDTPLGDATDLFSETAIGVVTKQPFIVKQLNDYAKLDDCIVGISNTNKITYRTATNPASTQQNLLTALNFTLADNIFKVEVPDAVKVRVAILDSGLDLTNTSLSSKVDTTYNLFFDFLGGVVGSTTSGGVQDKLGLGTQLASLIAGDTERSFTGLAARNVTLLPIKIRNGISQQFGSYHYLNMIKLAVNMRADVINLATADVSQDKEGCDPVVGHALLQAVRRNAFVVLSAGDNIEPDPSKPRRPGAFVTVKDNGPLFSGSTVVPGCWGRYLKGVLTVSASTMSGDALAPFSSWGEDAVEVAAPGQSIRAVHHTKAIVNSDSIVLPTAMVSAAAVMTIAYHKAKLWSYDPWLIEDVMLNSFPSKATLTTLVRRGKFLNFLSLANYLKFLESKTPEQRLAESTDNSELNGGWNADRAVDANLMKIDVYTKLPMVQVGDRLQLNTVAYYKDAVIKVVTESGTTYTSSNTAVATVNSQGIVLAKALGSVTITASHKGLTATTNVNVVDYDVLAGPGDDLEKIEIALDERSGKLDPGCPLEYDGIHLDLFAIYGDGSRFDMTSVSSFVVPGENGSLFGDYYYDHFYGGKTYSFYGLYRGQQTKFDFVPPKAAYQRVELDVDVDSTRFVLQNGGTFTVSQDVPLIISPEVVINNNCKRHPNIRFNMMFSSPDTALDALLKSNMSSASMILNLFSLIPGKTYQINVQAGTYRGNGVDEVLPKQTYYMVLTPPDIKDLYLSKSWYGYELMPSPLPLLKSASVFFEDSKGNKKVVSMAQMNAEFANRSTGVKLQAPRGFAYSLSAPDSPIQQMDLWMYPAVGDSADIDLTLTHLPSGFKKKFPLQVQGSGRYAGPDINATPFVWSNFSMLPHGKACPSGVATPLVGSGTVADPYVVCSPQQLISVGQMTLDPQLAPHAVLGRSLDFTGVILPKISLQLGSLNGGGNSISSLSYASADAKMILISSKSVSNIEFKDFSISAREASLLFSESLENVRFIDGMILANEENSFLVWSGSTLSSGSLRLLVSARNIRVENVEIQGRRFLAPLCSYGRVENFGAKNLTIRGSSVAGAVNDVGGIAICYGCTIVSSHTSGQISQVDSSVGGIAQGNANLIAVSSDMDIAARGDNVGGLSGTCGANIYKSSFSGTVKGRNAVGGIVGGCGVPGNAGKATVENVAVTSNASVQGEDFVGGIIGISSEYPNKFFDSTVDGNLYASKRLHPIANPTSSYNFRPADRYTNVKFKGVTMKPAPEILAGMITPTTPVTQLPPPLPLPIKTPAELGLSWTVQGATLSSGVYVINLGILKQGSSPIFRSVKVNGSVPFHLVDMTNTASISYAGTLTMGTSGSGYSQWEFGLGLPTETLGSFSKDSTFVFQTSVGRAELKTRVVGTVNP